MIDKNRLAELRDEVGENDLTEVVALFCEEVGETLDRILADPNRVTADDMHFLKGSALNVGMSTVATLCKSAEEALLTSPLMSNRIHQIRDAFEEARLQLERDLELL